MQHSESDAGTSSPTLVSGPSVATAANVRTWAGHRQAFPLGQAHTPLTSMPTLGRALTDGTLSEVDYVNTFLQHLAQHTGPEEDDSDDESKSEEGEEEEDDNDADDREDEDDDDYRSSRRKRRTRWRPNYPRIKKRKRQEVLAASRRRASVCVPTTGVPSVSAGTAIKKKNRRSNSVFSYFTGPSAESSPPSAPMASVANRSPPQNDSRPSPSAPHHHHQQHAQYPQHAVFYSGWDAEMVGHGPHRSQIQLTPSYPEPEEPSEWMAVTMACPTRQCISCPTDGQTIMGSGFSCLQPAVPSVSGMTCMPPHPHHPPALHPSYLPQYINRQHQAPPMHAPPSHRYLCSVPDEEDEVLASSSPIVQQHQQAELTRRTGQQHTPETHASVSSSAEEEGGWLEDLLRMEQPSSSSSAMESGDISPPRAASDHASDVSSAAAQDPVYAELFGY